mmetsp:Transcript_13985/g.41665  ORF Transcript_13985/g.41665 Transcript_13985/m.41665 type:complete len:586 (-) Transcript_13985:94-1851(-)
MNFAISVLLFLLFKTHAIEQHDHFLLRLSHEKHRDAIASAAGDGLLTHIRHLPSIRGVVVAHTHASRFEDDTRVTEIEKLPALARVPLGEVSTTLRGGLGVDETTQRVPPGEETLAEDKTTNETSAPTPAAKAEPAAAEPAADYDAPVQPVTDDAELRRPAGRAGDFWYDRSHPEGRPWNLDRINGAVDGDVMRAVTGEGVSVFVLDTGLDSTHPAFEGPFDREVENVADFAQRRGLSWRNKPAWGWNDRPRASSKENNDMDTHGTHVAATAAGTTFGAAPAANVYGMRILGPSGGASFWILEAFDAVAELAATGRVGPAVVSGSFGGPCGSSDVTVCAFRSLEARAIQDLKDLGVPTVIAAGNDNEDACFYQPAGVRAAITVGATTQFDDRIAGYSNWGDCIDVMAPGSDVPSAYSDLAPGGRGNFLDDDDPQFVVLQGTSMAAPLVAGTLALYMQIFQGRAELAVNAMLNNVEEKFTGARGSCVTNHLIVRTPGTTQSELLNTDPIPELCPLPGFAPRPTPRPTPKPVSRSTPRPTLAKKEGNPFEEDDEEEADDIPLITDGASAPTVALLALLPVALVATLF